MSRVPQCSFVIALVCVAWCTPAAVFAQPSAYLNFYEWVLTSGSSVGVKYLTEADSTDLVALEFSRDSMRTWTRLSILPPSEYGTYTWTVPDDTTSYGFLRITINGNGADTSGRFAISYSERLFRIHPPDDTLLANSNATFVWNNPVIPGGTWVIWYSPDSVNWSLIAGRSIALGENRFEWKVTTVPAARAFLRVMVEGFVRGMSTPFAVVESEIPSLTIVSPRPRPNVPYRIFGGSRMPIRWSIHAPQFFAAPLSIEYRARPSSPWTLVGNAEPRAGMDSIMWDIPLETTNTGQLRIRSADGAFVDSTRAELWAQYAELSILYPQAGDELTWGTQSRIVYRDSGLDAWGEFGFSSDGGATWKVVGSEYLGADAANGIDTLSWYVPYVGSDQSLVRIVVTFPEGRITAISDSTFRVGNYSTAGSPDSDSPPEHGLEVTSLNSENGSAAVMWIQNAASPARLYITSVNGDCLVERSLGMRKHGAHREVIELDSLVSGTYIVTVTHGAVSRSRKILVRH